MKKTIKFAFVVGVFSLCLFSAKAVMAVPFGDGGVGLQAVLDDIATDGTNDVTVTTDYLHDDNDSRWQIGGSGGSISTMVLELSNYSSDNKFGIYDLTDFTNKVELFGGVATTGDQVMMSILADNSVKVNFLDTGVDFGSGNNFGFYLETPGSTWYSDTSLNSDSMDHMAAYQGVGEEIQIDPFAAGPWGPSEYILAFEDGEDPEDKPVVLGQDPDDEPDYTDFVVLVESVNPTPVPEPATVALLGLGLVGLATGDLVRRRKKKAVVKS